MAESGDAKEKSLKMFLVDARQRCALSPRFSPCIVTHTSTFRKVCHALWYPRETIPLWYPHKVRRRGALLGDSPTETDSVRPEAVVPKRESENSEGGVASIHTASLATKPANFLWSEPLAKASQLRTCSSSVSSDRSPLSSLM